MLAKPLSDGTTAVGIFNTGRYELSPPPRARSGQPPPPQVWTLANLITKESTKFDKEEEAKQALAKVADPVEATLEWSDLRLSGPQNVRDLWRQRDLGQLDRYSATIPFHGVVLLKIGTPKNQ